MAEPAAVDAHPLDADEDLFEMANLSPRTTGLPVTVWASPRGRARQDARIKVCVAPGDRMDIENTVVVAIRPSPRLLHGALPPDILTPVLRWVQRNASELTAYWDGRTDSLEFVGQLQRV